jgi:hypothetical protein
VAEHPADAYAHVLLARTLQRMSEADSARPHLRLSEVMSGSR